MNHSSGSLLTRQRLINLAKVAVTAVLVAVIALTVDLSQLGCALVGADLAALLSALLIYQAGIFVRAYRWQVLLQAQGAAVPLPRLVGLYYVGTFFSNFLPTGLGGDVVKMYELRAHADGTRAVSTVLVDRAMGLLVLFALAAAALPFSAHLVPPTVVGSLVALIAGSALGVWLFLNRRLVEGLAARNGLFARLLADRRVASLYASFHRYSRAAIIRSALASLAFNALLIAVHLCIARAVGVQVGVGQLLIFVPILSSFLLLPLSISGMGVREGGYVLLFGLAGVASAEAVAMSLLFYALNLVTGLAGAALYLYQNAHRGKPARG